MAYKQTFSKSPSTIVNVHDPLAFPGQRPPRFNPWGASADSVLRKRRGSRCV